jgi:DNA-binding MarR family transcriptional regulator
MTDRSTQLFFDLLRTETRFFAAVDKHLAAHTDVRMGSYDVLRVIAATPGCRVLDIVAEIGITVGAASKSVDRLEAAGWAVRVANPDDRRSSRVELTASGRRAYDEATPVFEAAVGEFAGALGPDDLAHLAHALAAMRAALEAADRSVT